MRLFAQLSWYFRREWRRYLGAIALLIVIAILQLVPPKVVGIVVDGVTKQHYTAEKVWMWIGLLVVIAVMVYLLRYVWRVLLFGASYQLAVELREDFYRQLSRQHPAFYLRHRTGDLIARATNDVDRVVFAAGEGVLTLVDSLVMGCAVLIVMSTQISWQLTLLALLPMPLMALAIILFGWLASVAPKEFLGHFTVFALSCVVGYYVVWNVSHALHTPLMSVTNAISGIIVVGALLQIGHGGWVSFLSFIAVLIASINIFGGFTVTQRMLKMFRKG